MQSPLFVDTPSRIIIVPRERKTLSCSSLVTIVWVSPRIDSSITSFRSCITACDCSGVKPSFSRRWTTLSVSKFVDLDCGEVEKFREFAAFIIIGDI